MLSDKTLKEIKNINEAAWFILVMETAGEGFYLDNGFRTVQVVCNDNGKYLCSYMDYYIKYTNDPIEAYDFIKNYKS